MANLVVGWLCTEKSQSDKWITAGPLAAVWVAMPENREAVRSCCADFNGDTRRRKESRLEKGVRRSRDRGDYEDRDWTHRLVCVG